MPRLFPLQIYHFRKLDGRDKCSKERIRYGREIYVLSCFDNLGFQIRIISLEESIGRSRRLLFGFPHDDDDDDDYDDDYLVQDLGTGSSIRYSSHASRGCPSSFRSFSRCSQGRSFPRLFAFAILGDNERTNEDGKGITERETFPENPITRHNFCDICIWIAPRLRKSPFFSLRFFFAFLLEGNQSFSLDTAFRANWTCWRSCFEIFFPVLFHFAFSLS